MKKIRFAVSSKSALISASLCAAMCITIGGLVAATPARAQAAPSAPAGAPTTTAKIHGHAQDPLSQPVANTKVEITTDGKTPLYTFTTDASGDYTGSGIKPGTYGVILFGDITGKDGKTTQGIIDYQQNVKFAAGADVQADFDLTRQAYISKLSPEMQKKITEVRKQNAGAQQQNTQIKNVNKLITDARTARKAGNFDQAIAMDTQATQAKPDVGLTWYELGDSQLAAKKYDDAATNYKKALALMATDKKPDPAVMAAANNNLGEALAKSGKVNDAVVAYETAAKADPTQAGKYYGNEAIVLFKTGQGDAAGAAADKAIAADPTKPIPFYIKGWSLVQHATVDPKTSKIVLPPGCADAYHKFLSMAPTGPLADDAHSILEQSGEAVHKSYKKH
ncbi:MAG: tetratricopeptide repeat protein [Armatimonadota bacterium]|nr:tetratricopeptide repeat protein [Armatimonadota bacterium]